MHPLLHLLHGFHAFLGLVVQVEDHSLEIAWLPVFVDDRLKEQMHLIKIVEVVISPGLASEAGLERRGDDVLYPNIDIPIQVALDPVAITVDFLHLQIELLHGLLDGLNVLLHFVIAAFLML